MDYKKLDKIGEWLNSQGFDINLKDEFWMEDYISDEMKIRDFIALIIEYEKHLKQLNEETRKDFENKKCHSIKLGGRCSEIHGSDACNTCTLNY